MSITNLEMDGISVLKNIKKTEIFKKYYKVLKFDDEFVASYADLCEYIYRTGDPGQTLMNEIIFDVNALTAYDNKNIVPEYILYAANYDIKVINCIISLDGTQILKLASQKFQGIQNLINALPIFPHGTKLPFETSMDLLDYYKQQGYGYFARSATYTMENDGIKAISSHDTITLDDLKGYKKQKESILANTLSFVNGNIANNILLYGDKGTGKSSTVKAVVNQFADKGLKIIELPIYRINYFPEICKAVEHSPFKFIVFLDDLCFEKEDENFTALKAFIEGGIAGKPNNLLIYATSNRRHLVREGFGDRQGDEVHVRDTLETITSLSDRFGLEITFSIPNKDEYLYIVDKLACEHGLDMDEYNLHMLAERFALRKNGRSPRTARQFINHQIALNNK